jgi:DNA-binding NarL/FixJ family response regulator
MIMEPIRMLIADDHPHFRAGLRALLVSAPDLEVVGEAADGDKAVSLAAKLQPDVILMDLYMPGVGGIEATRRILHTSPHISVLVISMFEDDDSIFAALQAGARGYLLKGALKAEILRSIRAVASGEAIFGPSIAKRLMNYFANPLPSAPPDAFPELTEREREILTLIAQHQTNPEIAKFLHLSQKTVRNHVSNIFTKLQVADRAQAIIRAREAGLGWNRTAAPRPAPRGRVLLRTRRRVRVPGRRRERQGKRGFPDLRT